MANTYTSLTYHIVFSTKLRRKLIRRDVESELHKYIAGIIREHKSQPLEIGGVEDHIHIVTGIAPTIALSDMVRLIKANSSKWFNEIHARNVKFGWQTGYAAFTVSQSQSSAVRKLESMHAINMNTTGNCRSVRNTSHCCKNMESNSTSNTFSTRNTSHENNVAPNGAGAPWLYWRPGACAPG